MVVYARGTNVYGPFESYAGNPVLTNRNLGGYLLQGCGHADLVDDPAGNWWMVHLGFRQLNEWVMHHITGREVYLTPVTFGQDGWFTAGDDGTARLYVETDRIPDTVTQRPPETMTFANTRPGVEWCWMKAPQRDRYDLSEKAYRLRSCGNSLDSPVEAPTFLGIRQQEMMFRLSVTLDVAAEEAGVTCYMTPEQHYELAVRRTEDGIEVFKRRTIGDLSVESDHVALPAGPVELSIEGSHFTYTFSVKAGGEIHWLGSALTKYLSTEVAGNFTGVMLGLYAQGAASEAFATFTAFSCKWQQD